MVSIEELKLGNETLEALNFLLSQTSDLEKALGSLDVQTLKAHIIKFQNLKEQVDANGINAQTLEKISELLKNSQELFDGVSELRRTGLKGDKGEKGERGERGPQGIQGIQGIQGEKGEDGRSFNVEAVGLKNELRLHKNAKAGFSFLARDTGELFIKNSDNEMDFSDPIPFGRGEKGEKGERGERGPQGIQGIQGIQGVQGAKGDTPTREELRVNNVDNTRDIDKPISTATQAVLDTKLGKDETATNSDKLDGLDSSAFVRSYKDLDYLANLNDFYLSGLHFMPTDEGATAALNYPTHFGGVLKVEAWSGVAKNVIQTYISHKGGVFTRGAIEGVWTPWLEVAVKSDLLGINQTWQDMTSQRLANTFYENTSDKPIYVSVMAKAGIPGGAVSIQLFINDILVSESFSGGVPDYAPVGTACGIVPKGARYKIVLNNISGPTQFHCWAELR